MYPRHNFWNILKNLKCCSQPIREDETLLLLDRGILGNFLFLKKLLGHAHGSVVVFQVIFDRAKFFLCPQQFVGATLG